MQTEPPARNPSSGITPLRSVGQKPPPARQPAARRPISAPEESHDDRLARIRQQIADGEYEVDPRKVARSIIDQGLV